MHRTAQMTLLVLVWLMALLPATATAAAAEPQAIDDPVEAVAPPAAPVPSAEVAVAAVPAGDAPVSPAAAEPLPDATPVASEDRGAVPSIDATVSGDLPLTGPDPRQLILLLVVGSVLVCGGITAVTYARAT